MGMNAGHKQAQAARGAGGGGGADAPDDGKTDGSFHSPAFLAAHIASLQETERTTWEEFKVKQAEDARKAALLAAQEDEATRTYSRSRSRSRLATRLELTAVRRCVVEFRRTLDRDRERRMGGGKKARRMGVKRLDPRCRLLTRAVAYCTGEEGEEQQEEAREEEQAISVSVTVAVSVSVEVQRA